MVIKLVLILIFVSFPLFIYAQFVKEFNFISENNPIENIENGKNEIILFNEISELKLISLGLIKMYQTIISSQQNNQRVCTFTPSCSHYGTDAIKERGIFWGVLMTSDRLLRCHNWNRKYYSFHPETNKCYDPVQPNREKDE